MGCWQQHRESKFLARDLALALVRTHLLSGHDVVVPQHLGRTEFIEHLDDTAHELGSEFVEVMLLAEPAVSVERFVARRAELAARRLAHPQADVADADVEEAVAEALAQLDDVRRSRPATRTVDASGDLDSTCSAVLDVIAAT